MPSGFIEVTESEMNDFIKNYGKPLERDVYAACDPWLVTYNDFDLGDWPDSVVARNYTGFGPPSGFAVRDKRGEGK